MPTPDDLEDPGLHDRFAGVYRGRHGPADALWWFRHPGVATPEGRPPPDADLPALRAEVYGPRADAASVERYAALLADVEADRAVVAEALRVARGTASRPAAPPGSRLDEPPKAVRSARRRRRVMLVAAGAAVAVLALAVVVPRASRPTGGPVTTIQTDAGGLVAQQRLRVARQHPALIHILDRPESLSAQDYFAGFPLELPRIWHNDLTSTGYPGRVGPGTLPLAVGPATRHLLVFLTCSAPDAEDSWALTASRSGGGRFVLGGADDGPCRALRSTEIDVPPRVKDVRMIIRLAVDVHYAVAVYER